MTIFIGIDPGIRGAISFLDGGHTIVIDMPIRTVQSNGKIRNEVDPRKLREALMHHVTAADSAHCYIEELNVFAGGSIQTMGSLEATKATIKTVVELCGIPITSIRPAEWQRLFGIRKKATSDTKKQSLAHARRMFGPHLCPLEKHDGRADALLIAHYGRRMHG